MIDYKRAYTFLQIQNLLLSIMIVGIVCNFVAVAHNEGKMPVYYGLEDSKHISYTNEDKINYPILSDKFGFVGIVMFSIGDVLVGFSLIGMIIIFIINTFTKYGSFRK